MQGEGEPAGTLLGATLGPYHVTAQIGRGGMGAVYRAVDKRLGRHVAIKSLLHEGADPRGRKRLMDEARRASRVASPYVATVYDVVEDGDRCYIVMEAIEGRRLDTVIWDEHPDNDRLTRYAAEIAEALSAIHAAGIVHRDLKPANVMITTTNHVKVMDFGLAQDDPTAWLEGATSGRIPSTTQSAPGTIAGTIAYMSPEQIRGEKLDGRSDLFSFGTVLHEAITGLHPFQRDSILATASAILNDPPEPPPEPAALASHALLGVAGRLLEKDREKRYPSAEHVRADLAVLAGRSPQRRRRWLPWAAAAAALAIGIATWTLWPAPKPTGARPVVAILPFEDRTGEAKGDLRAALMADVLAASLADSDRVRPLGSDRVREIVAGAGPRAPQSRLIDAVTKSADVRWLITGSVFKEGDAYYASVSAFRPGESVPVGSYRVSAAGSAAIAERAAAVLRDKLFGDEDDAGASGALWKSSSEEAQLLEQEARKDLRELRYRGAIEKLERALSLDPAFVPAKVKLAEALDASGYGTRAREAAERAVRDLEGLGESVARSSLAFEARALEARTHGNAQAEIEARRAVTATHGDDPLAHVSLANALNSRGKHAEGLAEAQLAITLDPKDPSAHLAEAASFLRARRFEETAKALSKATEAFEAMKSETGRAVVSSALGELSFHKARYDESRQRYVESARIFEREGLEARATRAHRATADSLLLEGKVQAAASIYERVLASARSVGDFRTTIRVLDGLGAKYLGTGQYEPAERYLREARGEALALGNPRLLAGPTMNLASLLEYTGRPAESATLAQEALALARESGSLEVQTGALVLLGDALDSQGRLDDAIAAYREVLDADVLSKAPGAPVAQACGRLSDILRDRGKSKEALDASERAVSLLEKSEKKLGLEYALVNRAITLTELGRYPEASRDLERSAAKANDKASPNRDLQLQVMLVQAMIAAQDGRWADAERFLSELRRSESDAGAGWLRFWTHGLSTTVAIQRRKPGDALRHARQAAQAAERMPRLAAQARALLAEAHAAAGEAEAAKEAARVAADEADRFSLPLFSARACAVLVGLAPRAEDREAARSRGQAALDRYLDGAPEDRRDAVKSRKDLAEMFQRLR